MRNYDLVSVNRMRVGWTVIELIFIIVIIGILGAMSLPKLAATRDDAKLTTDISNMVICIKDAQSKYTGAGINIAIADSRACSEVQCYDITPATSTTHFIVATNHLGGSHCSDINNVGGHLAKTYIFKGTNVSR